MIETVAPNNGRYSQVENASMILRSSFDDQNDGQAMNRQINTSLGWVDNGPEYESSGSPAIPHAKKQKPHNQTTVWNSRDPKKISIATENNTVKVLPKFRTTE